MQLLGHQPPASDAIFGTRVIAEGIPIERMTWRICLSLTMFHCCSTVPPSCQTPIGLNPTFVVVQISTAMCSSSILIPTGADGPKQGRHLGGSSSGIRSECACIYCSVPTQTDGESYPMQETINSDQAFCNFVFILWFLDRLFRMRLDESSTRVLTLSSTTTQTDQVRCYSITFRVCPSV